MEIKWNGFKVEYDKNDYASAIKIELEGNRWRNYPNQKFLVRLAVVLVTGFGSWRVKRKKSSWELVAIGKMRSKNYGNIIAERGEIINIPVSRHDEPNACLKELIESISEVWN